MNGSGCKNCPVKPCETMNYRGSTCSAQRARLGLGDPMTNADRIRVMSDEELAEVFGKLVHCGGCPMRDSCKVDNLPCDNVILEWLKQPAEGE